MGQIVDMHETLDSHYLWQSPWYNLRQDRLRAPDGREYTYTVVEHPGAVWVVPVTADGQVVLIWNYRHPVNDWCWEVPAGGLSDGRSLEDVARRELAEEVGGTAKALHYVGRFYTSNGICSEVAHIYLATGVMLGEAQREMTEQMEVRPVPVAEAVRMARSGEIMDGPSALALLWCEALLVGHDEL
ncbi:MAG: NUDIX hydrolase [Anaerolineae bacterium]|nr:NUDIX hydrolase [Anaerolineae bacterium]